MLKNLILLFLLTLDIKTIEIRYSKEQIKEILEIIKEIKEIEIESNQQKSKL